MDRYFRKITDDSVIVMREKSGELAAQFTALELKCFHPEHKIKKIFEELYINGAYEDKYVNYHLLTEC